MKILHINSMDWGGAANACLRLHQGLLNEGIDSKVLLKQKNNHLTQTFNFVPHPPTLWQRLQEKALRIGKELKIISQYSRQEQLEISLRKQRKGLEFFSYPFAHTDITESKLYQEADIVHLHWVANFLNWPSFFVKNRKPLVWTLHDQNPFLGIEHYAERFLGIDAQGKPIERQYRNEEINEEKKIIQLKKDLLKNIENINIVAPSRWLLECSQKSEVLGKYKHHYIPYGFPNDVFKLYNQVFCREILGLPQDKKVLLFVADSIESNRKGFTFLKKALEGLTQKDIVLCAIGAKANLERKDTLIELGRIQDERLMAMAYAAADVFIIPSLEDNLPNTMIESLLCGTPVVGFPTGGIIDIIKNGQNGYICENISSDDLLKKIQIFLDTSDIFSRKSIAQATVQQFNLSSQAKSYLQLYTQIIK